MLCPRCDRGIPLGFVTHESYSPKHSAEKRLTSDTTVEGRA